MATQERLAVLIDADNAQASIVQELLAEVSRYGTATIKRAYGDWTTSNLKAWKDVLHTMAIQPIQQFRYTTGKNSTDSALIIDAMDLLYAGKLEGFCLVSSDSDFTRLATRIREAGLLVYGFGKKHTPEPFIAACSKFIYTEILRGQNEEKKSDEKKVEPMAELPKLRSLVLKAPIPLRHSMSENTSLSLLIPRAAGPNCAGRILAVALACRRGPCNGVTKAPGRAK